jgi:protein gp37
MAKRLHAMGMERYRNGFKLTLQPDALDLPLRWRKPQIVFVNSMSDLFHRDVPLGYIRRVFDVMERAEQHTFQILTKRADRLAKIGERLTWTENIWMGVSVEDEGQLWRIDRLRAVPAKTRFLSLEPLIGPLENLNLDDIHWVIVGGESGPGARPIERDWVISVRDQCRAARVPFFFKQWGGVNKRRTGRRLDGELWDQMPSLQHAPAAKGGKRSPEAPGADLKFRTAPVLHPHIAPKSPIQNPCPSTT